MESPTAILWNSSSRLINMSGVNLRRLGFLMAMVLTCNAPLQALALTASLPCDASHLMGNGDMQSHDGGQYEEQKARGCASCMACCAGAAIPFCAALYLPDSPPDRIASTYQVPSPGSSPARLDRPPQ